MRRIFISLGVAGFLLVAIFLFLQQARGQSPTDSEGNQVVTRETQGDNTREISAPPGVDASQVPTIGFIDSPSPVCYQPDPSRDSCYINWYYMSVDAAPNYMIAMTATINTVGIVARTSGFFQTSMYVPYAMFGDGFEVSCGPKGSGGNPNLGMAYAWTLNARDSNNLKSANYGSTFCPAFIP